MENPFETNSKNNFPNFDDVIKTFSPNKNLTSLARDETLKSSENEHLTSNSIIERLRKQDELLNDSYLDQSGSQEYYDKLPFNSPSPYTLRNSLREYQICNNIDNEDTNPTEDSSGSLIITPIKRGKHSMEFTDSDEEMTPIKKDHRLFDSK